MSCESTADEAEGRMGYWLRGHEGERNNCFSKIQLVDEKYRDKTTLASKTQNTREGQHFYQIFPALLLQPNSPRKNVPFLKKYAVTLKYGRSIADWWTTAAWYQAVHANKLEVQNKCKIAREYSHKISLKSPLHSERGALLREVSFES